MISIGIVLAILSMIFWGVSDVTIKKLTEKFDTLQVSVYKFVPHVIFLLIFFLLDGFLIPSGIDVWGMIFAFGLVGVIGLYSFVRAIECGLVSINVTVAHTNVIFTAIIAVFILDEVLGPYQYLAIGIIIVGVILLSLDRESSEAVGISMRNKGLKFALLTSFCWGVIWIISKLIIDEIGPYAASFYQELSVVLFILLIFLFRIPTYEEFRSKVFKKKNLLLILGSALASSLAIILMLLSFTTEKLTVSMGLISAAPFVTLILAYIFLKERIDRIQLIAVITVLIGIVTLSYLGG